MFDSGQIFFGETVVSPIPPNNIANSVRFNSADSARMQWTPNRANTDATKFTISVWFKRCKLGTRQVIDASLINGSNAASIEFTTANTIDVYNYTSAVYRTRKTTTMVFDDTSAWYHVVAAGDSTTSTLNVYINGVQLTSFTNVSADTTPWLWGNNGVLQNIGYVSVTSANLDCYLAELNMIDGQMLTPSSFGAFESTTGAWQHQPYTGTYGNNGYHLPFSNPSTLTTLCQDYSGNTNNFTATNLSVTAGVGNDVFFDTPISYSDGTYDHGFFPTINSMDNARAATISNGNLDFNGTTTNVWHLAPSNVALTKGKYYFEVTSGFSYYAVIGVVAANSGYLTTYPGADNLGWGFGSNPPSTTHGGSSTSYGGGAIATGDVISCAVDCDNKQVFYAINGVWRGTSNPSTGANPAQTGLSGALIPTGAVYSTNGVNTINFGQKPFVYPIPTGYKAVSGYSAADSGAAPRSIVQAVDYTGSASSQSVTTGMQPQYQLIKSANGLYSQHFDDIRSGNLTIPGDASSSESSISGFSLNSTSFTVPANTSGISDTGVINHGFSLREFPSGFSRTLYTGDGTPNRSISHSLGVQPFAMIVRARDSALANKPWYFWHQDMASTQTFRPLQATVAETATNNPWGTGGISSTTFGVTNNATNNANNSGTDYIAYLFANIPGLIHISTYNGNNNANGPFVHCGFRPKFIMFAPNNAVNNPTFLTATSTVGNLFTTSYWFLNGTDAANAGGTVEVTATGFKLKSTSAWLNGATTYRFIAFADLLYKYTQGR